MTLSLNTNTDAMTSQAALTIAGKKKSLAIQILDTGNRISTAADALSLVKDADYATETTAFASASVLQQAGVAVLAQANQQPRQLLDLLPR
ncbi:MAG: hypothetical protein RIR79_855 [Pseudomonadota bacterium]|jgi:flagellin-like hook-associated protein FlgL